VLNALVRRILCSRWHAALSGALLLLTYTGRRTGRLRSIPVQYATDGEALVVLAGRPARKRWWRNLSGGAPVTVRLRGRSFAGRATVLDRDPDARAAALRAYATRFPRVGASRPDGHPAVLVRIDRLRESPAPR
jgi:deazaflavin-dependent oxidoreductase (nitroreductase family)